MRLLRSLMVLVSLLLLTEHAICDDEGKESSTLPTPTEQAELPPETVAVLRGSGNGTVLDAAFSSDGKRLALGKSDGSIALWVFEPGQFKVHQILQPEDVKGSVDLVRFSPDGRFLASVHRLVRFPNPGSVYGTLETHVQIWGFKGDKAVPLALAASKQIDSGALAFHPKKPLVVFGSNLGEMFEIGEGEMNRLPRQFQGANSHYMFSPEGNFFASVFFTPARNGDLYASEAKLWQLDGGDIVERVKIRLESSIKAMALSPEGPYVATGSLDRTVRIWDVARQPPSVTGSFAMKTWPRHLQFTPDGKRLVATASGNEIIVWNLETSVVEKMWTFLPSHNGPLNVGMLSLLLSTSDLSPDGQHLVFSNHTPNAFVVRMPQAARPSLNKR